MSTIAWFPTRIERVAQPDPAGVSAPRLPPTLLSRHSLRVALGVIWLLDGALQLQSFMFTKGFADQIIAASATGQPSFVAGPVAWNARVIAVHPLLLNGLFAGVQLALGLGFLFRRSARVAIVGSIAWAAGVWYLGEGLGGLAGGTSSALIGAPGAAPLYAVLALAAWPRPATAGGREARRRRRPPRWLLAVWSFLWVGFATLNLLPSNLSPHTTSSQLSANAEAAPAWLAAVDRGLASGVHASGYAAAVAMVALELAIGLLVFGHRILRQAALWSGILLAGLFWAVGQGFGQLFSGRATDPSTGPLVILMGLAALGALRPDAPEEPRRSGCYSTAEGCRVGYQVPLQRHSPAEVDDSTVPS